MEAQFLNLCEKYAQKNSAIFTEYISNKKRCVFKAELRTIIIEFCYVKKADIYISPGTIYCRIFLRKNSCMYYHLPEILPMIGKEDFRSCYFPFIENTTRMKLCFEQLVSILDSHISNIEKLAIEIKIDNSPIFESYKRIYKLKEKDIDFNRIEDKNEYDKVFFESLQKNRDGYLVNLFTVSSAYQSLILGDKEKALMLYKKREQKSGLLGYEKALVEFLQSDKGNDFSFMPDKCLSLQLGVTTAKPSLSELLLNTAITYIPFAIMFCLAFAAAEWILSINAKFYYGAPWYGGFLVAGLCAIFGGIALRNPIKRLLKGKRAVTAIEMDKLVNSKGLNVFANIVFTLVIAFSVFASFMIISSHSVFYEDTFKYTNENGIWEYSEYKYSDIESVYYMKSRYNDYGDKIDRASYVLEMKDGGVLDFDAFASIQEVEKTLIPFLSEKGFKVKTIDSDKELKNNTSNKTSNISF